jgi:hypothetical protein
MPRPKAVTEGSDEIRFFSEVDVNTKDPGKIGSSYPSWYLKNQLRILNENIEQEERELQSDSLPAANIPIKKAKIKKMKARLDQILEAKEALKPSRDRLKGIIDELSPKLSEIMYRRSDETKGLVNPEEIHEHWTTPCVEISGDLAKVAVTNGMRVKKSGSGGLINEIDAGKLWKFSRAALGEDTNLEKLRRD